MTEAMKALRLQNIAMQEELQELKKMRKNTKSLDEIRDAAKAEK